MNASNSNDNSNEIELKTNKKGGIFEENKRNREEEEKKGLKLEEIEIEENVDTRANPNKSQRFKELQEKREHEEKQELEERNVFNSEDNRESNNNLIQVNKDLELRAKHEKELKILCDQQKQLNMIDLDEKERRREIIDGVLYLFFLLIFCVKILPTINIETQSKTYVSVKSVFSFYDVDIFTKKMNKDVLTYYNNLLSTLIDKQFNINERLKMISNFRLTQRKVKIDPDYPRIIFNYTFTDQLMPNSLTSYSTFNSEVEDNSTFTNNGYTFKYNPDESFLKLGGYVFKKNITDFYDKQSLLTGIFNTTFLNINKNDATAQLNAFYGDQSVTLTMDFSMVNYEVGTFSTVLLESHQYQSGLTYLSFSEHFIDASMYRNSLKYFTMGVDFAFVIIVILNIIFFFKYFSGKIRDEQTREKIKIYLKLTEQTLREKTPEEEAEEIKNQVLEEQIRFKEIKSNLFKKFFLHDFYNVTHLISIILSLVIIALWGYFFYTFLMNFGKIFNILDHPFSTNDIISDDDQNQLVSTSTFIQNYNQIVAITFLFIFLRTFKYLPKVFPKIEIFFGTIQKSSNDFISFIIFFLTMLLSFVIFSYMYFGNKGVVFFTEVPTCLLINFSIPIGVSGTSLTATFKEMFSLSPYICIIYVFLLILFIKYIMLKMLLSIIIYYFKVMEDEYEQKKNDMALEEKKDLKKVGERNMYMIFSMSYIKCTENFINCLCCKKKNYENENKKPKLRESNIDIEIQAFIEKYTSKENEQKDKERDKDEKVDLDEKNKKDNNIIEVKQEETKVAIAPTKKKIAKDMYLKDIQYSEDYILEMKNRYFISELDEFKLKTFYETQYKQRFIQALYNMLFVGLLTLTMFFNILTPWQFSFQRSVDNALILNSNFYYVNTVKMARDFVFTEFTSNLFFVNKNNTFIFNNINQLIGNQILITVKRLQKNANKNFDENVRVYESLDKSLYENDTNYLYDTNSSSSVVKFSVNNTYRREGGYYHILNLSEPSPPAAFQNALIDPYVSKIVVECFVKNIQFELLNYIYLEINVDYSGYFFTRFRTIILKTAAIIGDLDYPKLVFEVVFACLVIYYIVDFFNFIYIQNKGYDKWALDQIEKLSTQTKIARYRTQPEIFRKLGFLLSFDVFLRLFFLACCCYFIVLRIRLLIHESYLGDNGIIALSKNIIDVRDFFYEQIDSFNQYMIFAGIILIVSSLQILKSFSIGKYFSILKDVIYESKDYNFLFILIICLIQFPFACYSYIAFGNNTRYYFILGFSNFGYAVLSCFLILLGNFDFFIYVKSDQVLGNIFFYIYMFFMNIILINLFIAIIDKSYNKIKEKIKNLTTNYDFKRVFFFCCFRQEKKYESKTVTIEKEFEYELKPEINMQLIDMEQTYDIFAINEIENLKRLEESILAINTKSVNLSLAWLAKNSGSEYIFEDNLFQGVSDEHIKSYSLFYKLALLNVSKRLEEDIEKIQHYNEHLEAYNIHMNYENEIKKKKEENDVQYEKIQRMEELFSKLLSEDIEELKKTSNMLDEINLEDDKNKRQKLTTLRESRKEDVNKKTFKKFA